MDIKDVKQAEEILKEATQNEDIKEIIDNTVEEWDLEDSGHLSPQVIFKIQESYDLIHNALFENDVNDTTQEALQIIVFAKFHDLFFPEIKTVFWKEDSDFYKKCKFLHDLNVSVEEFGANEDYDIPLTSAIVELSVIDIHKSPIEKMNCLYRAYDLVFAEIKTALVSIISQYSDKENDIPIINNSDIIPILMMVIIKSKLHYMPSNLLYIKSLYFKLEDKRIICDIFKSFNSAVNKIIELDVHKLKPKSGKIIRSIDLQEYMRITTSPEEETQKNKSLVNEENQRILTLITRSTSENELF